MKVSVTGDAPEISSVLGPQFSLIRTNGATGGIEYVFLCRKDSAAVLRAASEAVRDKFKSRVLGVWPTRLGADTVLVVVLKTNLTRVK